MKTCNWWFRKEFSRSQHKVIIWRFPQMRVRTNGYKWMVYKGKSPSNGWFGGTPISGNLHTNPFINSWSFLWCLEFPPEWDSSNRQNEFRPTWHQNRVVNGIHSGNGTHNDQLMIHWPKEGPRVRRFSWNRGPPPNQKSLNHPFWYSIFSPIFWVSPMYGNPYVLHGMYASDESGDHPQPHHGRTPGGPGGLGGRSSDRLTTINEWVVLQCPIYSIYSIYISIYPCMYVCMYVCIYIYIHSIDCWWICHIQISIFHWLSVLLFRWYSSNIIGSSVELLLVNIPLIVLICLVYYLANVRYQESNRTNSQWNIHQLWYLDI